MKHLYLLTLLALFAFAGCEKDDLAPAKIVTSDFDPAFARVLQERGYIPDAEKISTADLATITTLDVSGAYDSPGTLTSLRGIEHFKSLTALYCSHNQLTELDVTQNTALTYLDCLSNELTELDVSNCTALEVLFCHDNPESRQKI